MSQIHVLHENDEWVVPLREAFATYGLEHREWFLDAGTVDLAVEPPAGVFYNRMSASSHTRGHRFAPELTAGVLAWLKLYDRTVINDGRALELEVSKIKQYAALEARGVKTPRTVAAVGKEAILSATRGFDWPLILKPNRGGKGLGVRLFNSYDDVESAVRSDDFDPGLDGVVLVQQYIRPADTCIIRNEYVGGRFLYAVRVDTADGGFELCPADACEIGDLACPVGEEAPAAPEVQPRFRILDGFEHPNHAAYAAFLADNGVGVAGIEMIVDDDGVAWTYDVNTNTNYNSEAEQAAGYAGTERAGMRAIARYLGDLVRP